MGKLRAEPGAAVASAEGDDAGERRLILVRIEAEVVMRDAPARLDGRRLGAQQARSRERELARSEEQTSELQSQMRISNAVFCLYKKKNTRHNEAKSIKL